MGYRAAAVAPGLPGPRGNSAYETALELGFIGTESEWIAISENVAGLVHLSLLDFAPNGYLIIDGSEISRTTYARLFSKIGIHFGAGDGVTTFNLPDGRGRFPRFTSLGSPNDPDAALRTDRGDGTVGDAVGTLQSHQIASHRHSHTVSGTLGGGSQAMRATGSTSTTLQTGYTGGNETRPINMYFTGLIKY